MKTINSQAGLRDAIMQLEVQRALEERMLKEKFNLAYNSVKPINLIKNTIKEAAASLDLKENLLNTSIGLTAGYLSKVLLVGLTRNPLKQIVGSALMFIITNVVAKNPETVKSLGKGILNLIKRKPSDKP
jgi:hypothetical protein